MRRALALTLAVVLVVSSVALAAPTDTDGTQSAIAPVTPAANTTAYLTIPPEGLETAGYQQATLDASGTVALDSRQLHGRFTRLTLDARFDATASTEARRKQIETTADRIETRITRLRQRQSTAVHAYNNGSLAAREFVFELVAIDTTADRLSSAVERVTERASSVPRSEISGQPAANWERNRYVELGTLEGPVRERIGQALRGENTIPTGEASLAGLDRIGQTNRSRIEPLQVYVETSRDGIVLTTIDDGRYYREAFLPSERNTTGSTLDDIGAVSNRVEDLYPWTSNNSGTTELSGDRRAGIYQVRLFHDHGRLTAYLDRNSGQVFAEQQRKDLTSVPTTKPVVARAGDLRLRINRTHPTGPLELSLTEGGEPVDGSITVDNQSVGRTGSNGNLWTVAPHGEATIVARAGDRTVRVETSTLPSSSQTAIGVSGAP